MVSHFELYIFHASLNDVCTFTQVILIRVRYLVRVEFLIRVGHIFIPILCQLQVSLCL